MDKHYYWVTDKHSFGSFVWATTLNEAKSIVSKEFGVPYIALTTYWEKYKERGLL